MNITIINEIIIDGLFPISDINRCPAIMFAVNRTANDPGRIILLILSIITINGIKTLGVPVGTKWQNIILVFFVHPNIIIAVHMGRAIDNENTKWADDVNTYGVNPIKLLIKINIIIEIIIIFVPLYFINIYISLWSVFVSNLNIIIILFFLIQILYGIVNKNRNVLNQFIDIKPVHGSKIENKLFIIFN